MYQKLNYKGWPNCVRLYNGTIELIATTDVGPRIIHFGFTGKQNFFYVSPDDAGRTKDKDWRIYGGHRLWHAPEEIPRTYFPDNDPVSYDIKEDELTLTQSTEPTTGIMKEIQISFESETSVKILHRMHNLSNHPQNLSPWSISAMAGQGCAIIPQEPFGAGNNFLLPARPLVLWQYAQMKDSRWTWGNKYILAKQDPSKESEQKIGVLNKQGWVGYALGVELFIKRFSFVPGVIYPDYNCNNEVYINKHFLELESLGPVSPILPGKTVEHTEYWQLAKIKMGNSEEEIDQNIKFLFNS